MTQPECRHNGDAPRLLKTHLRDCNLSGCPGCEPCPARHCTQPGCPGRHLADLEPHVCAKCVGNIRTTLADVVRLAGQLLTEAVHNGVDCEAAMLAGPSADPTAWRQRGRYGHRYPPETYLGSEHQPLWVLETWDRLVVEHLDQTRTGRTTLAGYVHYLDGMLTDLARDPEFPIADLARELRHVRSHLEDVLRDGIRKQRGAPCTVCGQANLEKQYDETTNPDGTVTPDDWWWCRMCGAAWWDEDYRAKVVALYPAFADRLTAAQIATTYRVPEGTVRRWANGKAETPTVRKRGYDGQGRQLYDVADVRARRDQQHVETRG